MPTKREIEDENDKELMTWLRERGVTVEPGHPDYGVKRASVPLDEKFFQGFKERKQS